MRSGILDENKHLVTMVRHQPPPPSPSPGRAGPRGLRGHH